MAKSDYLPENPSAFAEWIENFDMQAAKLAAKYGIGAGTLTQLAADKEWAQYWAQAKLQTENQKKQVNDYWGTITGKPEQPSPAEPDLTLPPNPPASVSPGIRKRVRDLASFIKGNKAIYTEADGELLGIVGTEHDEPDNIQPDFTLETMVNFALEVEFRKMGFDALRVEFQRKGDASWQLATILTNSPGIFNVVPKTPGEAEQIMVRAIFLQKNQPVGAYSDIKTALIAP